MTRPILAVLVLLTAGSFASRPAEAADPQPQVAKEFKVCPIGYVRKADERTSIVLDKKYEPALLGVDKLSEIWVLWWFDRNDTPEKRAILQVHPGGNPDNPIRGVFATHSPVRPNLIAITRCKVLSVKENVIEIESIDAFADTPVLDIKN
ncbi:MAG: SAM-dependent methyltransferase [Candidatus Anammoximicrobium sp.]|nr:SAM-dependent methyltransferase [Candidatus Anammoximicrobium sp.]